MKELISDIFDKIMILILACVLTISIGGVIGSTIPDVSSIDRLLPMPLPTSTLPDGVYNSNAEVSIYVGDAGIYVDVTQLTSSKEDVQASLAYLEIECIECVHAEIQHGVEAIQVRECLNNNGTYQVFKSREINGKYYLICQLGVNLFGIQIIQKVEDIFYEKTSFIKGGGTWKELMEYFVRKGATRYTGVL